MPKPKKPKRGVYVEVVKYGHGCHEIVAAYDVDMERIEELAKLLDTNPIFTPRNS